MIEETEGQVQLTLRPNRPIGPVLVDDDYDNDSYQYVQRPWLLRHCASTVVEFFDVI